MLKIKWLGQGGYLLFDEDTTICIDPYLSDVVNKAANRPRTRIVPIAPQDLKADAVICTHNHLDHIDTDAIPLMKKDNMVFYSPKECEQQLSDLGVVNYHSFNEDDTYKIGKFTITATFAKHSVPAIGVIVKYNDTTLYFTGDTEYDEKLKNIKCNIMFICINGRLGNMNYKEAIKLNNVIKPKVAIPNHYDMFESNSENPKNFTNNIDNGFIMNFNKEYEVNNHCLI